jgi:lysophospholipase L1-like esterase
MAQVVLEGNSLVVVCQGKRRSTGVTINRSQPEQIDGAVRRAIAAATPFFYGVSEAAGKEVQGINASAAAAGIKKQIAPKQEAAPAPKPKPKAAEPAPRQEAPKREERRAPAPPARKEPAAPREEPRPAKEKGKTSEATPRPTISQDWIDAQLREARRDDRKAQAAAGALHSNRIFIERYLRSGLQRGVQRSDVQKNATIAVFNALYQVPAFRLLLSSIAAQQQSQPEQDRVFRDFITLQAFLSEPGRGEQLTPEAEAGIISAADMYIRYFLFNFAAAKTDMARFREEIGQLPYATWRLENVEGARTFQPATGKAPTELDRAALMRLYISSAIDADTITAATLYLRRWSLEHPERGKGKDQDRIAVWSAPEVLVPEEPKGQVSTARPARTQGTPRVVVIGDSIVAAESGRIGTSLQGTLRQATPAASVATYGVNGDSISGIHSRFQKQVLDAKPPYNTVVIQGGVNSIMSGSVQTTLTHFSQMIRDARARGMKVIIIGITPWAECHTSSNTAQIRTREVNDWLRKQATADGTVVFVDTAPLGEGNPPRLRTEYERKDKPDHLHPGTAGLEKIASLIAEAAYQRAPTQADKKSELELFAERNWRNLSTELAQHAKGGNPAGIIMLSRNLPQGYTTIESALRALNRNDIARALDKAFNEFIHADSGFLEFCRGQKAYKGVASPSVALGTESTPADRRLVMRAIQAYIDHVAGKNGGWEEKFGDDLRILMRQAMQQPRDNLDVNGIGDLRTLAAVSLLQWRMSHRNEPAGAWGNAVGIKPAAAAPQPKAAPQPVVQPPAEGQQRRRVIHP